jgi:uncharacterized membrane protein affecting hemolysin expression
MNRRKSRATLLVLLPVLLSALASIWLTTQHMQTSLDRQGQHFGNSVADQLSQSLKDYLVNEDILSLNVVLNKLVAQGNFDFASIYSADNRLLAQAGRAPSTDSARLFTRDITWQSASVGYLQIGLGSQAIDEPVLNTLILILCLHLLIGAATGLSVWFYSDLIYLWIALPAGRSQPPSQSLRDDTDPLVTEPRPQSPAAKGAETQVATPVVMVAKLLPARLLPEHIQRIGKALSLYGGELAPLEGDNMVINFSRDDAIYQAICSGLLLLEMFRVIDAPISLNVALEMGRDATIDAVNTPGNARKHASYLASMADNKLLVSVQVFKQINTSKRCVIQPYQSALSPDGQVFEVEGLDTDHQRLIHSQARQLLQHKIGRL